MNKLAIQETFPPGIVGREIVLAQMCHHYRRISSAKARIDTNLFKPPKICLSRPLSAEVASVVQRSLSPRSPPKHRRCLKYEHDLNEHHFKPSARSQTAESRLRATPEVYHPAVKPPKTQTHQESDGQQQATQTSLETSLAEDIDIKTKDEAVQTLPPGSYRPIDSHSVQFLRDITNEALQRRAFTSSALNRIFLDHQFRNTYSLSQELMEKELDELRRQLGMLPRQKNGSTVSDAQALDALDALVLDPRIKEQVIHSLRLSRNDEKKKPTYTYFDRLSDEEAVEHQLPTKDEAVEVREEKRLIPTEGCIAHVGTEGELLDAGKVTTGWDATIEEEEDEISSASSSKDDESQDEASKRDSSEEEVETASDEEEVTQRESTSTRNTETASSEFVTVDSKSDRAKRSTSGEESSLKKSDEVKNQSTLQSIKLESLTSRGDKWRTSLEVVKEESDSTTGQVSDLSTSSTPTEVSNTKEEKDTTNSSQLQSKDTTSSTGGEIVKQMDDLIEEVPLKEEETTRKEIVEPNQDDDPESAQKLEEEAESESDEGSEVESIHSETDQEEEDEEKETDSEMSSVHSE